MKQVSVTKTLQTGETATSTIKFPETVAETVSWLTEPVTMSIITRQLTLKVQSYMSTLLKGGKTAEEIQAAVNAWKPGMVKPKKSAVDRILEGFTELSPEEKKAMLEKLRASK